MIQSKRAPVAASFLLALSLAPGPAPAQSPTGDASERVLSVAPVVVTDTRTERSAVTLPAAVEVITRAEIEASGATHVVEVLRGRGGLQVWDLFGDGSRAVAGMRGFGQSANANTLVLVDGRRLNNNDIAPPDLNSIALEDVERIEIIQGSAGTLYGDQAVGGVINVISRRPRRLHYGLGARVGSYESWGLDAAVGHRLANGLSFRIAGAHRRSDNYRDHNDIEYRNLGARVGFDHGRGSMFGELRRIEEELETPGALFAEEVAADRRQSVAAFANDFLDTDTTIVRVGGALLLLDPWSVEVELTRRKADIEGIIGFRSPFFAPSPLRQSRDIRGLTPRLVGSYDLAYGELVFTLGYDLEWSDYEITSVLGRQRNDQVIRGAYGQVVIPVLPRVSLTLGARHAEVENDLRDDFTFPAGIDIDDSELVKEIGLAVRPHPHWRLFARRDEVLRFAKVDEFTDPPPGVILETQTGVSYELGAEWDRGDHSASLVLFRLDLDDEIATAVPRAGGTFFGFPVPANTNIEATRRDGVIVSGRWQATRRLALEGSYTYVDDAVRSGDLKGKRIPFVANHIARFAAAFRGDPRWGVYGEVQAIGDRVFDADFDNLFGTLPGYAVVNLKADYRLDRWRFEARLNNLLDKEYSDFGAVGFDAAGRQRPSFQPAPERNAWLTVRYELE